MNQIILHTNGNLKNIPDLKDGDARNAQRIRSGERIVKPNLFHVISNRAPSHLANPERRCNVIE